LDNSSRLKQRIELYGTVDGRYSVLGAGDSVHPAFKFCDASHHNRGKIIIRTLQHSIVRMNVVGTADGLIAIFNSRNGHVVILTPYL
jgi:hypothetical protein